MAAGICLRAPQLDNMVKLHLMSHVLPLQVTTQRGLHEQAQHYNSQLQQYNGKLQEDLQASGAALREAQVGCLLLLLLLMTQMLCSLCGALLVILADPTALCTRASAVLHTSVDAGCWH